MPSKNIIRIYIKDGIYHIYNRGFEKRNIFLDEQDYKTFLYFLKRYLLSSDDISWRSNSYGRSDLSAGRRLDPRERWRSDLYEKIRLLCYCLMPNHYHLMIQQLTETAITDFMRRMSNSYTEYFNKKYKRRGSLFEGRYKAALIKNERHFWYLPYYIHNNPGKLYKNSSDKKEKIRNYRWSSIGDYIGKRNTAWIYKKDLMESFIETEKEGLALDRVKEILRGVVLE